MAAANLF
jgi:hypothetical protein